MAFTLANYPDMRAVRTRVDRLTHWTSSRGRVERLWQQRSQPFPSLAETPTVTAHPNGANNVFPSQTRPCTRSLRSQSFPSTPNADPRSPSQCRLACSVKLQDPGDGDVRIAWSGATQHRRGCCTADERARNVASPVARVGDVRRRLRAQSGVLSGGCRQQKVDVKPRLGQATWTPCTTTGCKRRPGGICGCSG